jgi:carbonic anhydrase
MRRIVIALLLVAMPLFAQEKPAAPAPTPPPAIGPQQLWDALMQGNRGFVAGRLSYDQLVQERALFKENQLPPITILGCSDSRVPPELLFNQSLGALFVVRGAGNVVDEFGLASVEYAVAQGYTKLIVVLGHENCGAVKASLGGADPSTPSLRALATRIRTSFVGVPYDSRDAANVKKAIEANTRSSAAYLLAASTLIRDAEATDRVEIVSAYYSLTTGEVKPLP